MALGANAGHLIKYAFREFSPFDSKTPPTFSAAILHFSAAMSSGVPCNSGTIPTPHHTSVHIHYFNHHTCRQFKPTVYFMRFKIDCAFQNGLNLHKLMLVTSHKDWISRLTLEFGKYTRATQSAHT
jgi:hypothetical protein